MLEDRGVGVGSLHYSLEVVSAFNHQIIIVIQYIDHQAVRRSLRSCFHKQEVNKPEDTFATRFYTLLLQPRRRIYLIQDSFCLTGIEHLYAIYAMASYP